MDRSAPDADTISRFELAPPRHFVLPAILLLLSEEAGYGYRLVKDLEDLGLGRFDRARVYRALSQLEADSLVESWEAEPSAGQTRRVYGITRLGTRALREWVAVVKDQRDGLDRFLRRYRASGDIDAVIAEVEGGWATGVGSPLSSVSPTSPVRRRSLPPEGPIPWPSIKAETEAEAEAEAAAGSPADARPGRYRLVAERSVALVEVRSSAGPISFGTVGLAGWVDTAVATDPVHPGEPGRPARAHVEISVDGLRSGNALYDAELLRRIDAGRFPLARLDLDRAEPLGVGGRHRVAGRLRLHGTERAVAGTADVAVLPGDRLRVTAEEVLDVRDYGVRSPSVLMLRMYPDVRVHLHLEAELGTGSPGG